MLTSADATIGTYKNSNLTTGTQLTSPAHPKYFSVIKDIDSTIIEARFLYKKLKEIMF
jgi:hypothetical protein